MFEPRPYEPGTLLKEEDSAFGALPDEFAEPNRLFSRIAYGNHFYSMDIDKAHAIVDTAYKLSVLDDIRVKIHFLDGSKKGEEKLKEILIKIKDLCNRVPTQHHAYSFTFGLLTNHAPRVYEQFRWAIKSSDPTQTQLLIKLVEYKKIVGEIPFGRLFELQGKEDLNRICRETKLADELIRVTGDSILADWLRTMPTGYGNKGRKRILGLFDKRIRSLRQSADPALDTYHNQIFQIMARIEEMKSIYSKVIPILFEQQKCCQLILRDGLTVGYLQNLFRLVKEEQESEAKILELIDKNSDIMKMQIVTISAMNRSLIRLSNNSELALDWYNKNKGTIEIAFCVIALTACVLAPPYGCCLLSLGTANKLAKTAKSAAKMNTLISKTEFFAGLGNSLLDFFRSNKKKKKKLTKAKVNLSEKFFKDSLELGSNLSKFFQKALLHYKSTASRRKNIFNPM